VQDLTGQVALITGGGSGLGAALCRVLGAAGMIIVVADVAAERAQAVAAAVVTGGGEAMALPLDVTDADAAVRAVAEVADTYGRLDVLINSAGIDVTLPITDLTQADFDRVLAVNLRGPFALMRAVWPVMTQAGRGHIVNITSTAAKRSWGNASAYHASKWGLLGMSHGLHVEGRLVGIKVTAVVNAGMRTPFIFDRFPDTPPEVLQDPMDVAETVRFVLSQPAEVVIPELMVMSTRETSWP